MFEAIRGRALMSLIVACSSCGFLLVGYDNGVLGGLVNNEPFTDSLGVSVERDATLLGTIVAIYEIGCCVGALATAFYGERLGRRKSIMVGAVFAIIGAILQATAGTVAQMIIGRIVTGLGVGSINCICPVLLAESAAPKSRGRLACVQLSTLNAGIMIAYWVDYGFNQIASQPAYAWRIPVALQIIFMVSLLLLAIVVPETPRWLAAHGRGSEALVVLARLADRCTSDAGVQATCHGIMAAVELERDAGVGSWREILKSDKIKSRRRFLIACGIQFSQQAGGVNGLIFYSGIIFSQSIRLSNSTANLVSGLLFTWLFVASFIPHFIIDWAGRRKLLLVTVTGMSFIFAIEAGLIKQLQQVGYNKPIGIAAAAMLFLFMALFTIGFQAVVWLIPSEVLPLRLRNKGSAISTASNWITNYAIVQITPIGIKNLGWKFYLIFFVMNLVAVAFMYWFIPETAGMSLEAVDELFIGATGCAGHWRAKERSMQIHRRNTSSTVDDETKVGYSSHGEKFNVRTDS